MTPHAKTVNALLETQGYTLADFLKESRAAGISYSRIARKLETLTGGVVQVTGETIRQWLAAT